jgi:hypothetical protein
MNVQPTRLGNIWPLFRFCMALIAATGFGLALPKQGMADCNTAIPSNTPLNDLGPGFYQTKQGGLYPDGLNQRTGTYGTDGIDIATNQIYPRNAAGSKDLADGKVVMVSIGMCNALMEFGGGASSDPQSFIPRAGIDPSLNPHLILVNGAQAGADAPAWTSPTSQAWNNLIQSLPPGISRKQVQVVWLKEAWIFDRDSMQHWPPLPFPGHATGLQSDLEAIIRNIKTNFPNCQITYLSPRTRAYTTNFHNPEPKAYETGFAVKWTIADQIADPDGPLGYQGNPPAAPWICWGPYLWTNGTTLTSYGIRGRSDGLTWECGLAGSPNDVRHTASGGGDDYVHPAASNDMGDDVGFGRKKVADQLFAFLKTDPTATPWFLKRTTQGQPPTANITSDSNGGQVPKSVTFNANAADPDGTIAETLWTFDDGDYSLSPTPVKWFTAPGVYNVHLTVIDNSGNSIFLTKAITMTQ